MEEKLNRPRKPYWSTPSGIALLVFGAIGAYLLIAEHRVHALGFAPYLILLACLVMHFFMHRGHGGHGAHAGHERHANPKDESSAAPLRARLGDGPAEAIIAVDGSPGPGAAGTSRAGATTLIVSGMTCGHCAASVRKALERVAGVEAAEVTVTPPRAVVTGAAAAQALIAAVESAGYQAELRP